jgi:YVTN family beta-propeller protein
MARADDMKFLIEDFVAFGEGITLEVIHTRGGSMLRRSAVLTTVLVLLGALVAPPTLAQDGGPISGHTYAYVGIFGHNSVGVIDAEPHARVATIPTGARGAGVVYPNADGSKLFVLGASDLLVTVIDTATWTATNNIPVHGLPQAASFTPDGSLLYVAYLGVDVAGVDIIDTASETLVDHFTFPLAMAVAVSPDGERLYITTMQSQLFTLDRVSKRVIGRPVPLGIFPTWLELSTDGAKAYVVSMGTSNVTIVDLANQRVLKRIGVGALPLTAAMTPDRSQFWVPAVNGNRVTVIDTATDRVVRTIRTDHGVGGVAFTPDGTQAWLAEAAGPRVLDPLNLFLQLTTTAVSSFTAVANLTISYPGQLVIYDTATYEPTGTSIPLEEESYHLAFVTAP